MAKDTTISIPTKLCEALGESTAGPIFERIMALKGEYYRDTPSRKTCQVMIGGQSYFLKQHYPVGWLPVIRRLFAFKKPNFSAMAEVSAIRALSVHGIATTPLVAFGERGYNPAKMQSFLITEDLGDIIALQDFCEHWQDAPPDPRFKAMLIKALASLATKLHAAGLSHGDLSLRHIVLQKADFNAGHLNLTLIDLESVKFKQPPGGQSMRQDITALVASASRCGFSEMDWQLFRTHYLPQKDLFWSYVFLQAGVSYQKQADPVKPEIEDETDLEVSSKA